MGEVESLSLASTSDLVVKCPWSPGIIEADDPILPRTRLAVTFRTLFMLRKHSREALQTAFADPVERLEQIHSFRLAAEEDGLRLSVTYDFGWESYMRALKEDGGPLLDLLCCHCAGYPLARHSSLDAWQAWIASNQVRSDYFYSTSALTVPDLAALTQSERLQREDADLAAADRKLAGLRCASAEQLADRTRDAAASAAQAQAIATVAAMYRLTRYWTADVARSVIPKDAITLVLATRAMIQNQFLVPGSFGPVYENAFASELDWYRQKIGDESEPSGKPAQVASGPGWQPEDVQRGILTSFDERDAPITHGAAVFLAVTDAAKARRSLAALELASEARETQHGEVFRNLAFTNAGLIRIGLAPALLQSGPRAFRDGAAARAGSVGDLRSFHPSNWRPLKRNWEPAPQWEVEPRQVDVLVQLRVRSPGKPTDIADPEHPLRAEIAKLFGPELGLDLLAVEGLAPADPASNRNHLGFKDGISQPILDGPETKPWSDRVEAGALLVGRGEQPADPFWRDGSFLALRRMTIDRAKFDEALDRDSTPRLDDPDLLAAKLLGRTRDGALIGTSDDGNNFVFDDDHSGAVCPLDSHIRRANPRCEKTPRIMRRGMSFGPPTAAGGAPGTVERGMYFMAYCADLAEQYERILGWVNGGNSTRIGSYRGDPLSGVPEHSERTYRFVHDEQVYRLALPGAEKEAIGLSWSLYLFAPSIPAIRALGEQAPTPAASPEQAERGRLIIGSLQKAGANAEAWRAILNEPGARDGHYAEAIWEAIRADRGILDSPAGYLVGGYDLVLEVLRDDGERFSNRGARERIEQTIGQFHLGLDPYTEAYWRLSGPANTALRAVDEKTAFDAARDATSKRIAGILKRTAEMKAPTATIDLLTNLIEPLLADLATAWFDIPDGAYVEPGPHDWKVDGPKPRYPGDFWNPSRYAFNPFTSRETERMAVADGKATVAAVKAFIQSVGRDGLKGSVSRPMAAATEAYPDVDALAQVLVGCMIGGVPTVAGNAIRLLVEGLENGELDRAQWTWLHDSGDRTFKDAKADFGPRIVEMLQRAPVPELLWRVVARDGDSLGGQPLDKGRMLIFSLESAGRDKLRRHGVDNHIPYGLAPPGEVPPAPHGCPAREMANGTLLGLLVGLLESARFRPVVRGVAELRPLA